METVNINAPGYKMKGSPMQRNFNIGVATKTGVAGLTSGKSPLKIVWLAALAGIAKAALAKAGAAVVGAAGKVAGALGAKGIAGKLAGTAGKLSKVAATGKAAKAAFGATKVGKVASKVGGAYTKVKKTKVGGYALGAAESSLVSNIVSPPQSKSNDLNRPGTTFANMKFGTGGSAFTMKMKNSPIHNYKKGYYGV